MVGVKYKQYYSILAKENLGHNQYTSSVELVPESSRARDNAGDAGEGGSSKNVQPNSVCL